jgi:hypothetical protein
VAFCPRVLGVSVKENSSPQAGPKGFSAYSSARWSPAGQKSGVQRTCRSAARRVRVRTHGRGLSNRRPSSAIKPSSHDWTEGDALQLRSRRIIKMLLSLSVACASCRPALHVSAFPLLADATTSRHPPVACKLGFGHLRRAFSQSDMKAPFHSDDIDAIDEKIHQQTIAIQQCADEDECLLEEVRTPTSRALQPNSFVLTPSVPCPSPS